MSEFGVDLGELLEAAEVRKDIFDDRENLIPYPALGRLLLECERRSNCEHIMLLISQHTRLTDFGLAGQIALCAENAGEGLQRFVDHFNLHSSATTVSLITSGNFARFVYAIAEHRMTSTRQLQLGAMVVGYNILQDLFGSAWQPTVITIASRPPANPRPVQKFFQRPVAIRQRRVGRGLRDTLARPATAAGRSAGKATGGRRGSGATSCDPR